jgi:hypothetical protein
LQQRVQVLWRRMWGPRQRLVAEYVRGRRGQELVDYMSTCQVLAVNCGADIASLSAVHLYTRVRVSTKAQHSTLHTPRPPAKPSTTFISTPTHHIPTPYSGFLDIKCH